MVSNIKCYGFSYNEAEGIMRHFDTNIEPVYQSGEVLGEVNGKEYFFVDILRELRSELNISKDAVAIYTEYTFILTKPGIDILVIDEVC